MNELIKVIDHIRSESDAKCNEIARDAENECARIRTEYSLTEQEEYWNFINSGTKETEQRLEQLSSLAALEAQKLLLATQQEMLDEVFALSAKILLELPENDYKALLKRLGLDAGCSTENLVEQYRDNLSKSVISALFD